jgi:hypothetical protein
MVWNINSRIIISEIPITMLKLINLRNTKVMEIIETTKIKKVLRE